MRRPRFTLAGAVLAFVMVACSSGSPATAPAPPAAGGAIGGTATDTGAPAFPLPPPDRAAALTTAAGLTMETREGLAFHVHAHLDIFINGEHRTVPGGIGIVITDPRVHTDTVDGAPGYGGIAVACLQPCISPLHTHDITGVIHTESETPQGNTLGQLFKEWDVRLDGQCLGEFCTPATSIVLYVDGKETPLSAAADLALSDRREIAIVIGTPPARIPSEGDFSGA